jgi:hypothetical protein
MALPGESGRPANPIANQAARSGFHAQFSFSANRMDVNPQEIFPS